MVTLRALSRTINGQQQSPFGNNTSPERGNNNTTLPSSLNTRDTSYTKAKTRIATPFLTDHTIGAGSLDIPNKKNAVSGNKHQQIKRPGTSSHQSHNTNTFIVSTYGVDGAEVDEVDFDRLAKEIDGEMSNHASDEEIEYYYYYDELEDEKATDKTNIDGQKNQLHENNSTSLRRGRKGAHAQPAFTHINGLAKQPIPKYFTHAQRTSNFSTYQELPPTVLMYREREEKREEAAQLEKKLQAEQARNEANVSNPFYRGDKTALTPAGKKKAEVDKLKQKEKTEFDRLTAGKSALHGMRHAAHGKNTEALLVHAAALLKESLPLLKTTRE